MSSTPAEVTSEIPPESPLGSASGPPSNARADEPAGPDAPRVSRFWLLFTLGAATVGVGLSKDVEWGDAWQLPASGAAAALFTLAFAKSLDLLGRS